MANEYYQKLFAANNTWSNWINTTIQFPQLEDTDYQNLSKMVDEREIQLAAFAMNPWKASGPGWLPGGFLSKYMVYGRSSGV